MNRHIPYSKEEISDPNMELDTDEYFKAWGYSYEDINDYKEWRKVRKF